MNRIAKLIPAVILTALVLLQGSTVPAAPRQDVYEVYLQYTVIDTDMKGAARVEEAINAISVPRIGVKVHIVPVFIGNLPADTAYAIASGEKTDIVNVGLTHDISTMVSDGLLLPLDDLLAERGQDAVRATGRVSEAQKIGGVTYAVSQYPYAASCQGFLYNRDLAERYGLDMHDGMTLEELEKTGAALKEEGVYLTSVGLSSELTYKFFRSMETFGEAGNYGVILDPAESTEIVNVFASDQLRAFYKTLRRWFELGYLPENQMLDETGVMQLYAEGKLFCVPTNITAGQLGTGTSGIFQSDVIRTSDILISTSSVTEFMLGIASTCRNPEAAMDFINLIYADPEVANLLNYGVEGIHYMPVPGTEHVISSEGMPGGAEERFGSGFVKFGDPMTLKIPLPLTDDYYRELQNWEDSARQSLSFGYSFDAGEYTVEAIEIGKIIDEYLPILNVGLAADVDAQIDAMTAELEAAGINEIITENNRQLTDYLRQREEISQERN